MPISTEDCKRAIVAAWPAEYGEGSEDFKRVSKRGKKGEPIERLFYHRKLPLKAIVIEENGAIVKTTIKGLGIFDLSDESESDQELAENLETQEAYEFFEKHDLFQPSDFYFYVSDDVDEHQPEYPHYFVLVPVTFYERNGYMYDQELSPLMGRHLPDDVGEASSSSFCFAVTPDEMRAELAKRGFLRSEKFDAFMNR
ncbi:MAG: hypothetical protein C0469_15045 [Cyanobacteria bacterium DS2.3.42]|nr:hypothetical protein [Cyanobacteria bacterium DS2.3.42]